MHRARAYLALLLAIALLAFPAASAHGVSYEDLQKHRNAAENARQQALKAQQLATKLDAETAKLDTRIDQLQAEVDELDPLVAEASDNVAQLQAEVRSLQKQVRQLQRRIEATQAEYERQSGLLAERLSSSYREGSWYYIEMLLGAKDFGDLITRGEFINRVIDSNHQIAVDLETTKFSLQESERNLQKTLERVNQKRAEAVAVEKRWRELQAQREGKVQAQQAVYAEKSNLLAATKQNLAKLKEIAAAEDRASERIAALLIARGGGSGIYNGSMAWPVPGYYGITSPFGWRMHPILRYRRFHAGVDIASSGINRAGVVASGSGQIIQAGYSGGYGNVVMVDHGNGVVSVYGHLSSIAVSNGQNVQKGERIAAVGSTGLSTGPHLHFEVRINGQPVNPMNYLR